MFTFLFLWSSHDTNIWALLMYLYRYKTIVERILKARLVYESPNMNRAVSFEYMNRQLVWNEFSVNLFLARANSLSAIKFRKSLHCYWTKILSLLCHIHLWGAMLLLSSLEKDSFAIVAKWSKFWLFSLHPDIQIDFVLMYCR